MPIYEYLCKDCGAEFETLRSMKDADTPITCKKCLGSHTIRTLSVFNARSGEHSIAGASSSCGCGNCGGGSCGSCQH